MAGQNAERFTVFGDRTPGDFDALFVEQFGKFVIAERFGLQFTLDEFTDGALDAVIAEVFARFRADAVGEKELQFEYAMRGGNVFSGDGTADRGFVDADGFGDGGHVQRAQVTWT